MNRKKLPQRPTKSNPTRPPRPLAAELKGTLALLLDELKGYHRDMRTHHAKFWLHAERIIDGEFCVSTAEQMRTHAFELLALIQASEDECLRAMVDAHRLHRTAAK